LTLDDTDIPINTPVPKPRQAVLHAILPDILVKVNVITDVDHVVLNYYFEILPG